MFELQSAGLHGKIARAQLGLGCTSAYAFEIFVEVYFTISVCDPSRLALFEHSRNLSRNLTLVFCWIFDSFRGNLVKLLLASRFDANKIIVALLETLAVKIHRHLAREMASFFKELDAAVHSSFVGRYFEFEERNARFSVELQGAMATFMSMAYILAVNPRILADSGGPCVPDETGIFGDAYNECRETVLREFITSTAIASCVGCLAMGLLANLPIALAPGMGMNAYFTYSVIGFRGTGNISYEAAVTAVFIEGVIFFFLAVSGVRYMIVRLVPEPVRLATPAAIGAFLAHLGLQTAEGIGVVVSDIATAVTLGACPLSKRTPIVALTPECFANGGFDCVTSDAYTCDEEGGVMTSATTWVGILGLMMMLTLLAYKKRYAFLVGISFITFISWFRETTITYFPDTVSDPLRSFGRGEKLLSRSYFFALPCVRRLGMLVSSTSNR